MLELQLPFCEWLTAAQMRSFPSSDFAAHGWLFSVDPAVVLTMTFHLQAADAVSLLVLQNPSGGLVLPVTLRQFWSLVTWLVVFGLVASTTCQQARCSVAQETLKLVEVCCGEAVCQQQVLVWVAG